MGWAKIRDKIYKVGEKIEPHAYAHKALQKSRSGRKAFGNVEQATADYGGYAGIVAQVIPGVGTVVGAGLIAAATAAKYKLARDAQKIAIADEAEYQRKYAEEVAAYNRDPEGYVASLASPAAAFAPGTAAPKVAQTPDQARDSDNLLTVIIGGGVVAVALVAFLVLRR